MRVLLFLFAGLVLVGCVKNPSHVPGDAATTTDDGGAPRIDPIDLPSSCPCPAQSYCDLASNTCKAGCTADASCDAGQYCDLTARACVAGCRADGECGQYQTCRAHQCQDSCDPAACGDDGNPCTTDGCVEGKCLHKPVDDGVACADDGNPCSRDVCDLGSCIHPMLPDGSSCSADHTKYCLYSECLAVTESCELKTSKWTNYWSGLAYPVQFSCSCNGYFGIYVDSGGRSCNGGCASTATTVACFP